MRVRVFALFVCAGVFACTADAAEATPFQRASVVLQERCLGCHNSEKKEGELDLSTREALLKGGEEGPALAPGKADESRLIKKISGAKPKMPKEGKPLTAGQVAALREWIEKGAEWPAGARLKPANQSGPDFWAWQPLARPKISDASSQLDGWARAPIDALVLAKLKEKNLAPGKEADRATLIRRITFDLHGLPPSPDEIEQFLSDKSGDAYEKLVERLLASPRYGERWARHWLDVVHYGDTHGYDKDKRRNNAWPYRDYVIRSFNEDKPYAQFVKEQIAGDVLYPENPEATVATGFIAAGPWDFVGHTELKEGSTDKKIARLLDRDDMLSNVGAAFLSVTVYCARCHDHKFDPIPQKDYYALQAVFAGIERGDRPYNELPADAEKRRLLERAKREFAEKRDKLTATLNERKSPDLAQTEEQLRELNQKLNSLALPKDALSKTNGYHSHISAAADAVKWVQVDLGSSLPLDEIRLLPARPTDFRDSPGFGFPARFKVEISDDEAFFLAETIDDKTKEDFPNPGDKPYVIRPAGKSARFIRVTASRLWRRANDWVFALAELQVASGGRNVAAGAKVTALDSIEAGRWSTRHLVDGFNSRVKLPSWPENAAQELGGTGTVARGREKLQADIDNLENKRKTLKAALISQAETEELERAKAALADAEKKLKALPPPKLYYGPLPRAPREIRVLHRGNVEAPGDQAKPGALSLLKELDCEFKLADANNEGRRRAALAEWVASPKNALTWRSIVNRVWHYHFGKGIVDTPNDFGFSGGRPTHPELLDWLASEFLESGQSLKKLHRLIVCSAVYRQTSASGGEGEKVDADNRLLWRMNRRRLDAESLRDSLLCISGKLDLKMYGSGFDLFNFKDDHSPHYDYAAFAKQDRPETWRRTVYRFAVRSVPNPFLDCLDCADPNLNTHVRNTTNTALQALAMLNDAFIVRQAQYLAQRVGTAGEIVAQIELLYKLALGRSPRADETAALRDYIARHGLANACRMLVNSNEFMFVD